MKTTSISSFPPRRRSARPSKHILLAGFAYALLAASVSAREIPDSPAATMDAYVQWSLENLAAIEADMPSITAAAEAAAALYVTGDWGIAGAGDFGVLAEACGRSGGIMALRWGYPPNFLRLTPEKPQIVLFALRTDRYDEHLRNAREHLNVEHAFVVVMGPQHLIERARADGFPMQASFSVHSAETEGLFEGSDGQWLVPTTPVASMAALWVWTAEFVAACTRHGKLPVMHESYAIPGAEERAKAMRGQLFYDEFEINPVPAGTLGQVFLDKLRGNIQIFYANERESMRQAIEMAWNARQNGGSLYTFVHGHSTVQDQVAYANSPGYLAQLNSNWFEQHKRYTLKPEDFVFCLGYDHRYQGGQYGTWHEDALATGATLVWSLATYREEHIAAIREAGEMLIDQHWQYGDAVVPIPGTPVIIAPTSGHIAQLILRLFNAGLLGHDQSTTEGARPHE